MLLDDVNVRLLAELQADARLSLAELGRRVGLSPPAVAERVARLERERVILGYHARLDPRALGYALSAVIRAKPAPASCTWWARWPSARRRSSTVGGSRATTAT